MGIFSLFPSPDKESNGKAAYAVSAHSDAESTCVGEEDDIVDLEATSDGE